VVQTSKAKAKKKKKERKSFFTVDLKRFR